LLEKVPVKVILEPRTALIGAAACAETLPSPRRTKVAASKQTKAGKTKAKKTDAGQAKRKTSKRKRG
jgi:hypothetical protein